MVLVEQGGSLASMKDGENCGFVTFAARDYPTPNEMISGTQPCTL